MIGYLCLFTQLTSQVSFHVVQKYVLEYKINDISKFDHPIFLSITQMPTASLFLIAPILFPCEPHSFSKYSIFWVCACF